MKPQDLICVIDVQNVYLPGEQWACPTMQTAMENISCILDHAARDQVLFSRFVKPVNPFGRWNTYNEKYQAVNDDAWLNELAEPLQSRQKADRYRLCDKSVYSLMKVPEAREAALKATAAGGRLVLTGVVAECCVLSTAFEAIDLGCEIIYITDAVSGLDEAKESGSALMLQGLSPVHTQLLTTEEYLGENSR